MSVSSGGKPPDKGGGVEGLAGLTTTTSAWAGGAGLAGVPGKQCPFAEIVADQKKTKIY